jgi:hypothetical protein
MGGGDGRQLRGVAPNASCACALFCAGVSCTLPHHLGLFPQVCREPTVVLRGGSDDAALNHQGLTLPVTLFTRQSYVEACDDKVEEWLTEHTHRWQHHTEVLLWWAWVAAPCRVRAAGPSHRANDGHGAVPAVLPLFSRRQDVRCSSLAAEGQCAASPARMLVQCARSCGVCPPGGLVLASQQASCLNLHPQCFEWGALGECHSNAKVSELHS